MTDVTQTADQSVSPQANTQAQTGAAQQSAQGSSAASQTAQNASLISNQQANQANQANNQQASAQTGSLKPPGDIEPGIFNAYAAAVTELGIDYVKAQALMDKVYPAFAQAQAQAVEMAVSEWARAAALDKEYGGPAFEANLGLARKALAKFGTPELFNVLQETGLGSHPEVVRLFYRIGKQVSEDTLSPSGSAYGSQKSLAERLYTSMQ